MKRLRLERWATQIQQPPRNPRLYLQRSFAHDARAPRKELHTQPQQPQQQQQHHWRDQSRNGITRRQASTAASAPVENAAWDAPPADIKQQSDTPASSSSSSSSLFTPSHLRASQSAKLSALHARLSLPSKLPLQTLARCLIDPSADPRPAYNNASLAVLGQDLLGYYTSEYLTCQYPRLPMPVLFAAQYAYAGNATLGAMRAEWGVEAVAAPGPEVDPGLLQLTRTVPGNAMQEGEMRRIKDMPQARRLGSGRRNEEWNYRRGTSSRIVLDDQFGDLHTDLPPAEEQKPYPGATISQPGEGSPAEQPPSLDLSNPTPTDPTATTLETASASFIRALVGALYLHAGIPAAKDFHTSHILSRHLPLSPLFAFTHPTRDLSRLCAREGLEPPVARLLSETGRHSRTPVFVVGVYSGKEKLGEGVGSSLNEGRVRAAGNALRGWYLYSPPESEVVVPSEVEGMAGEGRKGRKWKPQMVDIGEIIT
ncbi:ribonuclease III [Hortaea werneckii]|nr:ribonuclease III [Hortaea werneckii]KAI7573560.1 ribonuclease III [Hortaea werneckii]